MFPLKKIKIKKCGRLARLGEQPLHQNIKTREVNVFAFKNFFPPFKSNTHGIYEFAALGSSFFAFFDSVLRFYSSPTSKYSILKLSSFPLVCFDLPLVL